MKTIRQALAILTPPQRRGALGLVAVMVIGMVLESAGTALVVPAIVVLTEPDLGRAYPQARPLLEALGLTTHSSIVVATMLSLVGINLVRTAVLAAMTWQQYRYAMNVMASLSERLFAIYLGQPYAFLLRRNSAELIRNVVTEVGNFTSYVILPAMILFTDLLVLAAMAALLMAFEPVGTAVVVGVLSAAAWGFSRITRGPLARWGRAKQMHEAWRLQYLQEGLGGAKEIKLLGVEAEMLERYAHHNRQGSRVAMRHLTMSSVPRLWLELLGVVGLAALVLVLVAQGRDTAAIAPTLALFAAAALRLMPSINRILSSVQHLRFAGAVNEVLAAELRLAPAAPATVPPPRLPFESQVALSGLTFTYEQSPVPALDRLSLVIRKGESVGLIGPSGSGKSTLVDVMLGLLQPDSGAVLVDGADARANLRGWQSQIGYVPQTIYLTDDTLRANVAFGVPAAAIDDAAVDRALRAAQLEDFVAALPDGVATRVGERGVRLSGGQRQRIGIARALYRDPAVLVLDEATSALDTVTERGVMDAVEALHGRKTIIVVAHRLSTVERCDRLYRMDRGRIVAEGRPDEMLRAVGTA